MFSGCAAGMPFARLREFRSEPAMSVSFTSSPAPAFSTPPTSTTLTAKPAQSVEQKFLEYAKMTPAERMHAQMLAQLGLTEDQFKAMSPAKQHKIEVLAREMIKRPLGNREQMRTGMITDK